MQIVTEIGDYWMKISAQYPGKSGILNVAIFTYFYGAP